MLFHQSFLRRKVRGSIVHQLPENHMNRAVSFACAERDLEFMDGFNQEKECDGIILMGKGDNEPDFDLQVMIDSHDTPGQKTVWNWVLKDVHKNRVLPVGFNVDSGKNAAKGICQAVWANTDPGRVKKPAS